MIICLMIALYYWWQNWICNSCGKWFRIFNYRIIYRNKVQWILSIFYKKQLWLAYFWFLVLTYLLLVFCFLQFLIILFLFLMIYLNNQRYNCKTFILSVLRIVFLQRLVKCVRNLIFRVDLNDRFFYRILTLHYGLFSISFYFVKIKIIWWSRVKTFNLILFIFTC